MRNKIKIPKHIILKNDSLNSDEVYTIKEAARYLKLSSHTIYKKTQNNEINHAKIGRRTLFKKEHLESYIDGHIIPLTPPELNSSNSEEQLKPISEGDAVMNSNRNLWKRSQNWWVVVQRFKATVRKGVGPNKKDAIRYRNWLYTLSREEFLLESKSRSGITEAQSDTVINNEDRDKLSSVYQEYRSKHSISEKTENTVVRDDTSFKSLNRFFNDFYMQDIKPAHVKLYYAERKKHVSVETIRIDLALLRVMFDWWCQERDNYIHNPVKAVKLKLRVKRYKNPLTAEEIQRIITCMIQLKMSKAIIGIFSMLAIFGARKAEIFKLEHSEINFDEKIIHIPGERTKNGEDNILPITDTVEHVLRTYGTFSRKTKYVFPNEKGGAYNDLRGSLNKAVKLAGITKHVTAKSFRDAFISSYQAKKVSDSYIMNLTAHKSVNALSHYMRADMETKAKEFEKRAGKVGLTKNFEDKKSNKSLTFVQKWVKS